MTPRRIVPAALLAMAALATLNATGAPVASDPLATVSMLRAGGCGGLAPAAPPVPADPLLDRTAQLWAAGQSLAAAAARSGSGSARLDGLHVRGNRDALVGQLRASACGALMNPTARSVGVYQRGDDTWFVVASTAAASASATVTTRASAPARVPVAAESPSLLAARAVALVNDIRARGTRCGSRTFTPAPPLALSGALAGVAREHASDMALHGYFEHVDRTGQTPADRVRAVGYHEKLVGENIAYGPESVEEVMKGWLASPGHCENIMDPRFEEMGIAAAAGQASRHGLYWVQVFAEPRAAGASAAADARDERNGLTARSTPGAAAR